MKKMAINILSLFISVIANRIFPVLLLPFLSRALGPEQFGRYVMASAFSYLLAQAVEWGFNMTGVRQVALAAGDRNKIGAIISTISFSRAIIGCVVLVGCAFASPWMHYVAPDATLYWAAVAYGLLYAFDFRFAFYGLQEARPFLILTFIQYLASFLLIVALVRSPQDAWLAFVIPTCCGLVSVLASLKLLQRWATFSVPSMAGALAGIRASFQVFLARNVFQSSSQLGVLALGLFASPQAVGWLGVIERICRTIGQLLLYPVQVGLTPVILQDARANQKRAAIFHLASLGLAAAAAIAAGVVLYFFAPLILRILLGSAPDEAVHILRLLCVYPLIFVLIHQGGIFWLYLMHWDRENLVILLSYTVLFGLLLVVLAATWQLQGVAAGILAAGTGLVLVYALFFLSRGILPWRQPLGTALDRRRQAAGA